MLQNNIMEFDIHMWIYRKNIDTFPEVYQRDKSKKQGKEMVQW